MNLIISTPWEQYEDIWVKREDLCCPEGPPFSKIRGLAEHLAPLHCEVGVLDTFHSKGGCAAAFLCQKLRLPCYVFYPGSEPHESQLRAAELGANLISLQPGRSAILYYRARKLLSSLTEGRGCMLPNGLALAESILATQQEVAFTPANLFGGTWVVSASTGTIAAGVNAGLQGRAKLIVHLGFSRSISAMGKKVPGAEIIDEGYSYRDAIEYPCSFPCNPYYDLKAWKWLCQNRERLAPPVVFWNIGA